MVYYSQFLESTQHNWGQRARSWVERDKIEGPGVLLQLELSLGAYGFVGSLFIGKFNTYEPKLKVQEEKKYIVPNGQVQKSTKISKIKETGNNLEVGGCVCVVGGGRREGQKTSAAWLFIQSVAGNVFIPDSIFEVDAFEVDSWAGNQSLGQAPALQNKRKIQLSGFTLQKLSKQCKLPAVIPTAYQVITQQKWEVQIMNIFQKQTCKKFHDELCVGCKKSRGVKITSKFLADTTKNTKLRRLIK